MWPQAVCFTQGPSFLDFWKAGRERQQQKRTRRKEDAKKSCDILLMSLLVPSLSLRNLSAAVKRKDSKSWNVCLDPAIMSLLHCFWRLPWVPMEDSDESMLTVSVTLRRREWRVWPGGLRFMGNVEFWQGPWRSEGGLYSQPLPCGHF